MDFLREYKQYAITSGVAVLFLIIGAIILNVFVVDSGEDKEIDVTKYELPSVLQKHLKENNELENGYISGSRIYSATKQKVKSDTIYTYLVEHLILPESGKFYDIENEKGITQSNLEGDSLAYRYDTQEIYVQKVYQIIVDRKGNHKIYTY